jgi:UDP-glucose 4-epimerase
MPASPPAPISLTGGRGCLAGVIARHFAERNLPVVRYSRAAGDGFQTLADLAGPAAPPPAGTILHLAWSTLPYSAEQAAGDDATPDLALLEQLLRRCVTAPARPHFVFFSSGGTVYGNARAGRPSREDDPCAPIGRHGRAKLAAEQLVQRYGHEHGLAWTILRISNPYGFPLPSGRPQGIIPVAINCARTGQPLTVWGDGTARKDFLHYTDFNRALEQVVTRRLAGIYNVSHGHSHSIRELLDLIERATGARLPTRHAPPHAWDVHDSLLDNTKLRTALDWTPLVPLAEGIARTSRDLTLS